MAPLDLALAIGFGALSLGSLALFVLSIRRAFRVATTKDGDVKMFFWSALGLVCLIVAGLSLAYILLPIIVAY